VTPTLVRTLRVFLCDDTPELRERVRVAFEQHPDLTVVGEADDPVDGLPLVAQLQPDVVLLDLSMPRMDGLEAIPLVAEAAPDAAIIVFSGFLSTAMSAKVLALGADGYVEKSSPLAEVADRIREAAQRRADGERPVPAVPPAPREQDEPAMPPARARALEEVQLPGDPMPNRVLWVVAALCLVVATVLCGFTGVDPDVLLALYLAPVALVAGRFGRVPGLAVALVAAGLFALGGELGDETGPMMASTGVLAAAVVLVFATDWARRWVLDREEHRAALTRELQRANGELDSFASVASHDLAAPLRTISGFADLLGKRHRDQLDGDAAEFLGFITSGVERMQQTIDDLLAFARAGRIYRAETPFSLEGPLTGARMNLAASIEERGASIHHGALPLVWGDERRVTQVLQNLIANGIKFCPPDRTPAIDVSAQRIGTGWRVEVRDNGIGIDPRHTSRAFGMFQRLHTEEEYPGTGVGLAICQRIVERHGGRIWIDPQPAGGTLVAFTLPDPA
jgi:signal transduction histidine kinase